MKKFVSIILAVLVCFAATAAFADIAISFQIGNPRFSVNGLQLSIDAGRDETVPVIIEDRTFLPIRAIAEALGGEVDFSDMGGQKIVHINYNGSSISLVIGVQVAFKNGEALSLDAAPVILNDRTYVPARFIAENMGFEVDWDGATQTVTISR